jgi:ABC-2 type transport system permease protein
MSTRLGTIGTTGPETAFAPDVALRIVAPRRTFREHVRDIVQYHELLASLIRKELKVKYKNSVLGFAWSLLNPLLYLAVYYVVFDLLLGSAITAFPIFLLSGLLVWNFFATSLIAGTSSIAEGGSLVKKVFFPREVLPLASEGAAFVHFVLQFFVLVVVMLVVRWNVDIRFVWLVVPALAVMLLLAAALNILLSAVNVYARDVKHLIEIVLLAWFWLTPIVYQWGLFDSRLGRRGLNWIVLLNPVTSVTLAFQRGIYNRTTASDGTTVLLPGTSALWYVRNLTIVGVVSALLLFLAVRVFDRLEGNFAEVI